MGSGSQTAGTYCDGHQPQTTGCWSRITSDSNPYCIDRTDAEGNILDVVFYWHEILPESEDIGNGQIWPIQIVGWHIILDKQTHIH